MRISDWSSDVCSSDLDARFLSQLLRFNLVAHRCYVVWRRANKDNPVFGTGLGETLPLRQEAIARMHCIGSSGLACFYNLVGKYPKRQGDDRDQCRTDVPEKQRTDERDDDELLEEFMAEILNRPVDQL